MTSDLQANDLAATLVSTFCLRLQIFEAPIRVRCALAVELFGQSLVGRIDLQFQNILSNRYRIRTVTELPRFPILK